VKFYETIKCHNFMLNYTEIINSDGISLQRISLSFVRNVKKFDVPRAKRLSTIILPGILSCKLYVNLIFNRQ
jgi:hypothetical protein